MSVVSGIDLSGTKINGQSGAVCAAAGKKERTDKLIVFTTRSSVLKG